MRPTESFGSFTRRSGQSCVRGKNNPIDQGQLGPEVLSSDLEERAWALQGMT